MSPERIDDELPWARAPARVDGHELALVIGWSLEEPERLGHSATVAGPSLLGRGERSADDDRHRLYFGAHRPHRRDADAPLLGSRISRCQLHLEPEGDGLRLRSVGRWRVFVSGRETVDATVRHGDTILLRNALLLVVVRRPAEVPLRAWPAERAFEFGAADPFGIIGESAATWALRDRLAMTAKADMHVLIHGPSGVGKELAARALHGLSSRAGRPFVARNAATLVDTLIDAELFGNARHFPNVGTPERPGLVGEADGASLFLDEIGELSNTMQAHLLRLLDRHGEYHRLGDAKTRRADLRIVAATNRTLADLKHDFAARLTARIALAGLDQRPEDVPLLAREVLRRFAAASPELERRFFERRHGRVAEPRIAPELIDALVRHRWTLHARELQRVLWIAIASSHDEYIGLGPEVAAELVSQSREPAAGGAERATERVARPAPTPKPRPLAPSKEEIASALDEARGKVARAATRLGLSSRYVLYRLMRQYGLESTES